VSTPIDALIVRARAAAEETSTASTSPAADRQRLERLASEFESMLLNQMLSDMRKAGRWSDDEEEDGGFGAQALFETLDAELSKQMSRAQGFGLSRQMMDAFDRRQGGGTSAALSATGTVTAELVADAVNVSPGPAATGDVPASAHTRHDVTSGFGWRRDPITGEARFHRGVDLRSAYGEDVAAVGAGKVVFSGSQGSYGTTVVVEHSNGTRTRYAHLSETGVSAGDRVERGQLIGRSGTSGRTTGPHLHLEVVDRHGRPIDPTTYPGDGD
jgi:murein DD-endopeptidase MepM/ murein hydrolase activator NlpD